MLGKVWKDLIKKYSFVDDVKILGRKFAIFYNIRGEEKKKELSTRSKPEKLQKVLKEIQKEMGLSIHGKGRNQDVYVF